MFFKRYVIDYIILNLIIMSIWIYSIIKYDGLIPYTLGILSISALILYIPYLIYKDYIKIKEIHKDYKRLKSNEISKEEFNKNLLIKVTDELGLPTIISEPIISKIILKDNV